MAADYQDQPSFSRSQQWRIGFEVVLISLIVLSIVVMLNYLSGDYFRRFNLSNQTRVSLSSRTTHLIKALTNEVKVTIYYDRKDPFYSTIADLLYRYRVTSPRISVQTVDYLRDPAAAKKVQAAYQLSNAADKNLVIFQCAGKSFVVDGNALVQYTLEQIPNEKERTFRRKPVAFMGELAFDSALLEVTDPKARVAYFLEGHREHSIDNGDGVDGYLKFAAFLKQNHIYTGQITLLGTNRVPSECNLLIIAAPSKPLVQSELEKIGDYLALGGRLLVLFNASTLKIETGLEPILAQWGIAVGRDTIVDREHSQFGEDVVVSAFSRHPIVNPLLGTGIYLIQPRPVIRIPQDSPTAESPRVEQVAFTGQHSYLPGTPGIRTNIPVIAVAEKATLRGVVAEKGTTRIVVVGDSSLFTNQQIDLLGNRDFGNYAINWLIDRPELLSGVGPKPVTEYRLVMTHSQQQSAELILLGGMPGSILLLGALVWLRRRR